MDKYFSKEEINVIISNDKVKNYTKDKLDIKTLELFKYFIIKKIKITDIKNMIKEYPRLLTYSIDLISSNYNSIEEIFNKNTNKLIINNPRILSKNKDYIDDRITYLKKIGMEEKDAKKVCLKFPSILTIGEFNIEISLKNLEETITDKKQLIYLIKSNPNILSFSNKLINKKIEWFYKKGYNKKQTVKIITKATSILTMEIDNEKLNPKANNNDSNIEQKYKYLSEDLKYTKEEIISITYRFPEYYTLSLNTIKIRVNNLIRLGFDINIVKYIFYSYPKILSFKIDTLNEKYNYYLKLDMLDLFIKNSKYLMQSLELTDARYNYLINKGLEVNKNNYGKLFVSSKRFKKNYGIDNENILKIYKENGGYYEQRTNKRNTKQYRKRDK